MRFINYPIVRFSVVLALGILTARFFPIFFFSFWLFIFLIPVLIISWWAAKKQFIQNAFFGIVTYCCFFTLGYASYQSRLPQFQPQHFSKVISENDAGVLQVKIVETLKPDAYNSKYIAEVITVGNVKSKGKLLINIRKDSIDTDYLPDTILFVHSEVTEIQKPLNPFQFDYSMYMKSLGVYGEIRVSPSQILLSKSGTFTVRGKAQRFRLHIIEKLKASKLDLNERAIVEALILGEKREINKTLYSAYSQAGAIHILAVSGLHVGILYFILGFLFSPFRRGKYGKTLVATVIVLCLWGFAFITGLSPSVTRAVTMFSFFAFATIINRPTNTLNTLFLSFLTLLVINPLWLFQVGFQLSYLAVFFILWLQPKLRDYWKPNNLFLKKGWDIITVTVAAQVGILPLSLYYFHQFPGLFLFTNLIVLPFLGVLMAGGIIVVFLAVVDLLPDWIANGYNYLIETLNGFVSWVARQDAFLFQDIHFSAVQMLAYYLVLICLVLLWKKITYYRIIGCLSGICVFFGILIYDDLETSKNELIVFHKTKQTLIGYKNGSDFTLFRKDSIKDRSNDFPIKPYRVAQDIVTYSERKLPNIFLYNNKKIMVLDSFGVYPKLQNIDILLLTNSPKTNLDRLIDSIKPKTIIADGSNYTSYVLRWEETCIKKKIPFYHTGKTGAFIIR